MAKRQNHDKLDELIKRQRILRLAIMGTKETLQTTEGEISESYEALIDCWDEFEEALTEYRDEKEL